MSAEGGRAPLAEENRRDRLFSYRRSRFSCGIGKYKTFLTTENRIKVIAESDFLVRQIEIMTGEKIIANKITIVNIDELVIAGYNPRTFTDKEYENLRSSIEGFGVVDPIITR